MTISTVATVPSTALLIPEVAAGASGELDDLRERALHRVSATAAVCDHLLVVAGSRQVSSPAVFHAPIYGSLRPIGVNLDVPLLDSSQPVVCGSDSADVPIAVSVAAWLLNEVSVTLPRTYTVVPPRSYIEPDMLVQVRSLVAQLSDARLGVLVIADGTATRTPKAPGAYVEGASDWDDRWATAWREVDCAWFMAPARTEDAETFAIDGVGAWSLGATLAQEATGEWTSHIDHEEDPYGVMYAVGAWSSGT